MTIQQTNLQPDLDADAIRLLIGPNDNYYIFHWNETKKHSFNWGAFLFIFLWMGYRKMYGLVAGILAVFLLIDVLAVPLGFDADLIVNVLIIAMGVFLGFFGTGLYRRFVIRKLRKLKARTASDELLAAADQRRAGWIGVVVVWVVLLVYTGLSNLIGRL
ncbi:DUF2628 domain-containing protein [Sporosarcina aquimarina]|uniref:DUF2628 domain-containing protein n=1 Tax=Sporosarcina aquimarina TaxID=114975 RepID=UPI00203BE74A|nr:DUF2628 domain-containing protein [Sporosarcina aquimarina]MCM3757372.1 DUF2628 domain-containing protein [Sporosarcina aquimarina]